MTTVEQALQERFSCRKFLSRQVPRDTIETMLRVAQMTPSWCNTQPWQITLLSGAEADKLRDKLYAQAKSGAPATPDFAFPPRAGQVQPADDPPLASRIVAQGVENPPGGRQMLLGIGIPGARP